MSDDRKRIKVVLCWHMHQPYYFNSQTDQYQLPWTYLHATKDYVDMANILAAHPKAKAVINFAPILLEQLDDYTCQIDAFINQGIPIKDPLLTQLVSKEITGTIENKKFILESCLRANEQFLIKRFKQFKSLASIATDALENDISIHYLNDQFFFDLLTWYHLAWMGESIKRENETIKKLLAKTHNYDIEDRHQLLMVIREVINSIIPKYQELSNNKQAELAFSPYAHPIVPLLLDFKSATEAMPHASLPQSPEYPGGKERAEWHFQKGAEVFEHYFHHKPAGCWPSEGGLSSDTVKMCGDHNIRWVASGESVMRNSIGQTPALAKHMEGQCLHRSYKLKNSETKLFFRDDGLSDLIGFTFSDWHSNDAVNNLIHHIENIGEACEFCSDTVVSIILDGENAWEHYPENAFHFLNSLYGKLSTHPKIELTTFSECLDQNINSIQLDELTAGSWVYGTFSTWIADKDKNRGWDLLVEAKNAYDKAIVSGKLSGEKLLKAEKQLAICEGSDWFWWFGDYNPSDSVRDFELLFRIQLTELYRLCETPPPTSLSEAISAGGGTPATGGVMRPGQEGHSY